MPGIVPIALYELIIYFSQWPYKIGISSSFYRQGNWVGLLVETRLVITKAEMQTPLV